MRPRAAESRAKLLPPKRYLRAVSSSPAASISCTSALNLRSVMAESWLNSKVFKLMLDRV